MILAGHLFLNKISGGVVLYRANQLEALKVPRAIFREAASGRGDCLRQHFGIMLALIGGSSRGVRFI